MGFFGIYDESSRSLLFDTSNTVSFIKYFSKLVGGITEIYIKRCVLSKLCLCKDTYIVSHFVSSIYLMRTKPRGLAIVLIM